MAIFVPITFDPQSLDTGGGNVTQALCSINLGFLGNFTLISCDQPDDTFDLIAGTGIILEGNATTKTILINSTGGGTVIGTQICPANEFFDAFFGGNSTFRCTPETTGGGGAAVFMNNTGIGVELFKEKSSDTFFIKTLVGTGGITITNSTDEVFINGTSLSEIFTNLGTGSQVFKNETGIEVFFRTLINGSGIAIQQDAEEISIRNTGVIDIVNVGNGSRVFKNVTNNIANLRTLVNSSGILITEESEEIMFAISQAQIANLTQFDNFEWARASDFLAFSTNSPRSIVDTFTNYKTEVLGYTFNPVSQESATWTSALPNPFPANSTSQMDLYWYREDSVPPASGSGVCWEMGVQGVAEDTTLDVALPTFKMICDTGFTSEAIDDLRIITFTFTQAEHQLFPKDMILLTVMRDAGDVVDDWSRDANFLGVRIVWDTAGS